VTGTLARSRDDRVLAGVMGGIARRFGWNSTLLRVLYVVVSIASAGFAWPSRQPLCVARRNRSISFGFFFSVSVLTKYV